MMLYSIRRAPNNGAFYVTEDDRAIAIIMMDGNDEAHAELIYSALKALEREKTKQLLKSALFEVITTPLRIPANIFNTIKWFFKIIGGMFKQIFK